MHIEEFKDFIAHNIHNIQVKIQPYSKNNTKQTKNKQENMN